MESETMTSLEDIIREEIGGIAMDLEKLLKKHDKNKGQSWKHMPAMDLVDSLKHEQLELEQALRKLDMKGTCDEILDNIAYLMFIYYRIKEVNDL